MTELVLIDTLFRAPVRLVRKVYQSSGQTLYLERETSPSRKCTLWCDHGYTLWYLGEFYGKSWLKAEAKALPLITEHLRCYH